MFLKIIPYGNPILRRQAEKIDFIDEYIVQLIKDMSDTLSAANGVGLAAPQIGVSKQLLIIDWGSLTENGHLKVYINPEIIEYGKSTDTYEEGCLSFPRVFANVIRPTKVIVRYQNIKGDIIEEKLNQLPARVFQHEFDHLQGILFIDRISNDIRKNIKPLLQAIMDGKILPFDPEKPETFANKETK